MADSWQWYLDKFTDAFSEDLDKIRVQVGWKQGRQRGLGRDGGLRNQRMCVGLGTGGVWGPGRGYSQPCAAKVLPKYARVLRM